MVGASLGATAAFLLAKTLLRESIQPFKKKYPTFDVIDQIVEIYGLRVTFLLRLSPLIPFNVFNYLMGLTSIKLKDYVIAFLGMIPGVFAFCFIGGTLGSLSDSMNRSAMITDNVVGLILLIGGTAVTVIGMIAISVYAKKKYAELKEKVLSESKNNEPKLKVDSNQPTNSINAQNDSQATEVSIR